MFKFSHSILTVLMLLLGLVGKSQQPVLAVKSFEYLWAPGSPRVIIPSDSSAKVLIKNSFAKAIQARWNLAMPEVSLSVKPFISSFSIAPKFNPKLKDKDKVPGRWYLFIQIFEMERSTYSVNEKIFYTELELKCKLINGTNDAIVFNRNLIIDIYKEQAPVDQVQLTRLPAYPASYVTAFDSIAQWLFQSKPIAQKSLTLKPACVFQEFKNKSVGQLPFKSDNEGIHYLDTPTFSFKTSTLYEKISSDKNKGGNFARVGLTMIIGGQNYKQRFFEYRADCRFKESDSVYHCFIGYGEQEIENIQRENVNSFEGGGLNGKKVTGSGWELSSRNTDSTALNVVTLNKDTLATFKLISAQEVTTNYNQMWDGSDIATVVKLPPEWNYKAEKTRVVISGELEGSSFTMKTSNETRIKEFYINSELVAITYGKNEPVGGSLFHSITTHQLKLFTILSSLPYDYLNLWHR